MDVYFLSGDNYAASELESSEASVPGDSDAWDAASKMIEKAVYLATAITEGINWEKLVVKRWASFKHDQRKGIRAEQKYFGELVQQHGYQEAMDFIRKGKYQELTDEWGDKYYKKTSKYEDESAIMSEGAHVGGTGNATIEDKDPGV